MNDLSRAQRFERHLNAIGLPHPSKLTGAYALFEDLSPDEITLVGDGQMGIRLLATATCLNSPGAVHVFGTSDYESFAVIVYKLGREARAEAVIPGDRDLAVAVEVERLLADVPNLLP